MSEMIERFAVDYRGDFYPEANGPWVKFTTHYRVVTAERTAREAAEAKCATQTKMLADCFRMAGADCDGNEDWRIADRALQAVTALRRDYDENEDWATRAQAAEAENARLRAQLLALPRYDDESEDYDMVTFVRNDVDGRWVEADELRTLLTPITRTDGG